MLKPLQSLLQHPRLPLQSGASLTTTTLTGRTLSMAMAATRAGASLSAASSSAALPSGEPPAWAARRSSS